MDDFQFIIESPQNTQGQKKRPRLVTSCDNCRLKKIKCLQPNADGKCDACKASKIPCRFKDRERYFAERSRAIAGPNAAYGNASPLEPSPQFNAHSRASSHSTGSTGRSSSDSPTPNGLVGADINYHNKGHYHPYAQLERRSSESSQRHSPPYGHRNGSPTYNFVSSPVDHHSLPTTPYNGLRPQFQLFDANRPEFPEQTLELHFIQVFFHHLAPQFPFLSYDETMNNFYQGTLPPLLQNVIASIAAGFSTSPDVHARGPANVMDLYEENVKALLQMVAHTPSMETLYALILLSWSKSKDNDYMNSQAYCRTAMRMAMTLGLSPQDDMALGISRSERERERRRATWNTLAQLHLAFASRS